MTSFKKSASFGDLGKQVGHSPKEQLCYPQNWLPALVCQLKRKAVRCLLIVVRGLIVIMRDYLGRV